MTSCKETAIMGEDMTKTTQQMQAWTEEFGKIYTDRNLETVEEMDIACKRNLGLTRSELNQEFIGHMDRPIKILEAGANFGKQLICLQEVGFTELYGIELQQYAVELSKSRTKNINLIQGTIFDIPFKNGYFDLVFTSGVLIHIHPNDIEHALNEIYRCTGKYIWGYEYYSEKHERVCYRGKGNLLWRANFVKLYLDLFSDLELVKEEKYKYLDNDHIDIMFLLKKAK